MPLIDRLARNDPQPPEGVFHIANHVFSAALWFLSKGDLTRAQIVTGLELRAEDEPQLDEIIAFYQTLNATQKTEFHSRIEGAGMLLEGSFITRAKYKTLLGMT